MEPTPPDSSSVGHGHTTCQHDGGTRILADLIITLLDILEGSAVDCAGFLNDETRLAQHSGGTDPCGADSDDAEGKDDISSSSYGVLSSRRGNGLRLHRGSGPRRQVPRHPLTNHWEHGHVTAALTATSTHPRSLLKQGEPSHWRQSCAHPAPPRATTDFPVPTDLGNQEVDTRAERLHHLLELAE